MGMRPSEDIKKLVNMMLEQERQKVRAEL